MEDRAMAWRVTGTREKLYRIRTASDVIRWVDDEIETMSSGWMPLGSESLPDGTLRVLYGRLPDDPEEVGAHRTVPPADRGGPGDRGWVLAIVFALATLLTTFAILAKGP
jgi:hypothetical protein